MQIKSPTADQIGELSKIIRDELIQFESDTPTFWRIREAATKYLNDLTLFKKKHRFIVIVNPVDSHKMSKFHQIDTDLDALPISAENGAMKIPSGTLLIEDADISSPKSWAAKRYRHVIANE